VAWARGIRLSRAFEQIRTGGSLDDAVFEAGFGSHSGFREAFRNTFQTAPGRSASSHESSEPIHVTFLSTPLGPMLAAATARELVLLEFADQRGLSANFSKMRRRLRRALVPGENAVLARLKSELADYFSGRRREFGVPYRLEGSPFQVKVWEALREVRFGATASYRDIAKRIDAPRAVRAVGRANGENRLYLIVPCHRVIAHDGSLSGYGGGVWRKKLLLDLEKRERSS
jgi:AraC family transcriptional regulator of adaptative response/methylated-DNA-[protein]-cysteine methyltransferase